MVKEKTLSVDLDLGIKNYWRKANEALETKNMELADDLLAYCLVILATATMNDMDENEKLGGVRLGLWKERVWMAIENNGLLPE